MRTAPPAAHARPAVVDLDAYDAAVSSRPVLFHLGLPAAWVTVAMRTAHGAYRGELLRSPFGRAPA